jgi:hypothetical protein
MLHQRLYVPFIDFSHRPRKLLLFVNPFGGKKKGLQIWEKRVQPLLNIADVETKIIVTERAGHIRETLLTSELESYHVREYFMCMNIMYQFFYIQLNKRYQKI